MRYCMALDIRMQQINYYIYLIKAEFQLRLIFNTPWGAESYGTLFESSQIYGKDESRGLSCGCTSSIFQDVMKSDNLLHKRGFVDSLLQTTVL